MLLLLILELEPVSDTQPGSYGQVGYQGLFRVLMVWVPRFVPGTIALGARFVPGAIDMGARFVPGAIALGIRFVPGDHFWVPTSTRNFQKNLFFRVKNFFSSNFTFMFLGLSLIHI